ncbi:MAG: DUF6498-containing protein [Aeromicrobium sp.]
MLRLVLRIVGVNALAALGSRLPFASTRRVVGSLLVLSNLMPLIAVARGTAQFFDVYGYFLMEAVVLWAFGMVRILTATGRGQPPDAAVVVQSGRIDIDNPRQVARFFSWHFGIFMVLSTITTAVLVRHTGGIVAPLSYWLILLCALLTIHTADLGLVWFGQDARSRMNPGRAMFVPYPAVLTLYTGAMVSIGLVLAFGHAGEIASIAVLCGLKVLVDFAARFVVPVG